MSSSSSGISGVACAHYSTSVHSSCTDIVNGMKVCGITLFHSFIAYLSRKQYIPGLIGFFQIFKPWLISYTMKEHTV